MRGTALAASVVFAVAAAAGCSVTKGKSAYPKQYKAFRQRANDGCKQMFDGLDTRNRSEVDAGLRELLGAQAPPDLARRWEIYKRDIRSYFIAGKIVSERAAAALDDGSLELGLDDC
jgi:hypothetical protein